MKIFKINYYWIYSSNRIIAVKTGYCSKRKMMNTQERKKLLMELIGNQEFKEIRIRNEGNRLSISVNGKKEITIDQKEETETIIIDTVSK